MATKVKPSHGEKNPSTETQKTKPPERNNTGSPQGSPKKGILRSRLNNSTQGFRYHPNSATHKQPTKTQKKPNHRGGRRRRPPTTTRKCAPERQDRTQAQQLGFVNETLQFKDKQKPPQQINPPAVRENHMQEIPTTRPASTEKETTPLKLERRPDPRVTGEVRSKKSQPRAR